LGDRHKIVEEEEDDSKKIGFGFNIGKSKAKEEEKKEVEEEENKTPEDPDEVSIKHLFKFECDITRGRQVSCIDINSLRSDLIAVSYGEYDIDCTKKLNPGLLAFWTLKNPTYPEK
jgi:hypothetical protein